MCGCVGISNFFFSACRRICIHYNNRLPVVCQYVFDGCLFLHDGVKIIYNMKQHTHLEGSKAEKNRKIPHKKQNLWLTDGKQITK